MLLLANTSTCLLAIRHFTCVKVKSCSPPTKRKQKPTPTPGLHSSQWTGNQTLSISSPKPHIHPWLLSPIYHTSNLLALLSKYTQNPTTSHIFTATTLSEQAASLAYDMNITLLLLGSLLPTWHSQVSFKNVPGDFWGWWQNRRILSSISPSYTYLGNTHRRVNKPENDRKIDKQTLHSSV